MQVYENGAKRIDKSLDETADSFAVLLMEAIIYYREFRLHGSQMLIVFSEEEEKMICDESRKLLKNRCSQPNESNEEHEKMLFAKALKAMISAIPVRSFETLILCNYTESVGGKVKGGRKIGILYHIFRSLQRDNEGASFDMTPIELTMSI